MSANQADSVMCRKLPGTTVGKVCERCESQGCVICGSKAPRAQTLVKVCDDCGSGSGSDTLCISCNNKKGVSHAYYCQECTLEEKDRDGCPRILNIGTARIDAYFKQKKYGFNIR